MTDEELYQQATDELKSDKRLAHIWAKACALASDDHDEARYLYTNLRAEELIEERDAKAQSRRASSVPVSRSTAKEKHLETSTLAMEPPPRNDVEPGPHHMDDTAERSLLEKFDEDLKAKPSEVNNAISAHSADHDSVTEELFDDTIDLTSELDGTAVFELNRNDATDIGDYEFDADGTDIHIGFTPTRPSTLSSEDELDNLLSEVYPPVAPPHSESQQYVNDDDEALTVEFSDVTGTYNVLDDDLDWLNAEADEDANASGRHRRFDEDQSDSYIEEYPDEETERLTRELMRQADELPGQEHTFTPQADSGTDADSDAFDESDHKNELDTLSEFDVLDESMQGDDEYSLDDTLSATPESEAIDALAAKVEREFAYTLDSENDHLDLGTLGSDAEQNAEHNELVDSFAGSFVDSLENDDELLDLGEETASHANTAAAASMARATTPHRTTPHRERTKTEKPYRSLPIDLSTNQNSGACYEVFRRKQQAQAVKSGVSWSALFLTLPYLIYRHLFGTAIAYTLMWLVILSGLLVSGLNWLDTGASASYIIKGCTVGFGILAIIGLLYIPFRYANQWRQEKLKRRGFERVARVRASSAREAIAQARRASALE